MFRQLEVRIVSIRATLPKTKDEVIGWLDSLEDSRSILSKLAMGKLVCVDSKNFVPARWGDVGHVEEYAYAGEVVLID